MSLRDGQPSEVAALEDLQRRASLVWEEYRADLEAHPDAIEVPAAAFQDGYVRVATGALPLLGFSVVVPGEECAAELEGLFVDPAFMRRGIGRALVDDAVSLARARGWTRIDVTANPLAVGFYVKLGFVDAGVLHTRFGPGLRMHLVTV